MKIDETPLNLYLIEHLKPLTDADPTLLSDYVAALLKKSKPKKELHTLCVNQLYDILGEDLAGVKLLDNTESLTGAAEIRISPSHVERLPSAGAQDWEDELEEEESSDDDRNHKHRRRVSRSRSADRVDEPNVSRYSGGGSNDLKRQAGDHRRGGGQSDRERSLKFDRRSGRDAGGRFSNGDQAERGLIRGGGPPFRGDAPNVRLDGVRMGRGRGAGNWAGPIPPPFADAPPLLPPNAGFFPNGRGLGGLGTGWPGGFGHMGGMGAGSLELSHGGRGPPGVMNLGMGMGIGPVRPRCLDFEERGFCLRGDLCPMDHGSHIVVEDVQSLSKFNLPVNLSNGRGMAVAAGQLAASNTMLPAPAPASSRGSRGNREPSISPLEAPIMVNGQVPGAEPDLYDPDQPLWNNDRPEATGRIRKLSAFQAEHSEVGKEKAELKKSTEGRGIDGGNRGANSSGLHGGDAGSTVWDRIGPVDVSAASGEAKVEEQRSQGRGVSWQPGRWGDRESDSGATNLNTNPGRVRGAAGWAEVGLPLNRSKEGTNLGPRAPGRSTERAQRTLYVNCIPPNSNQQEVLLTHFEKFGRVVDVRIPSHSHRAFVQFATREEAESALASPDAVLGNRFIRLSWANRDSITSDNGASTSSTGQPPTTGSEPAGSHAAQLVKGRGKLSLTGLNKVVAGLSGASTVEGSNKATTLNGSASSVPSPVAVASKKQEELELMREKIRQKQEALAQKRDDFRRKLNKLASQGVTGAEDYQGDHARKRQKADNFGDLRPCKVDAAVRSLPSNFGLKKINAVDVTQVGASQVSSKPTRSPHPRTASGTSTGHSAVAWGPARFKLDNRTTAFRVLPPFPFTVSDVAAVRDHFAAFGELSSVEVEAAEGHKADSEHTWSPNSSIRISYTTRWSAERAMMQGRCFHGQSLNLVWVSAASTSRPSESPAPAGKVAPAEHETTGRGGASEVSEEASAEEVHHVESKLNLKDKAHLIPARVVDSPITPDA
ncbi:zinc finger CCCH domain-containing protein 27 isoform X1 [Physcomitrium patens]|uniref:zinc finger CCCH domain-containing protein 27 isoform X1 n=1 Tax=Physcomitrium patens TaxID=3218 RepID=UPI003CCCD622